MMLGSAETRFGQTPLDLSLQDEAPLPELQEADREAMPQLLAGRRWQALVERD